MKQIWVKAIPYKKEIVTTALENGATGIIVDKEHVNKVKQLGRITTVSTAKSDLVFGKDVEYIEIRNKEDERKAAKLSKKKKVIVKTTDWTIIPLENLIAEGGTIFAEVVDDKSARTALEVLEKGVDGLVINNRSSAKVKSILKSVSQMTEEKYELTEVVIQRITPLGMGDRICIDTTTNMAMGEGMLTGNSSSGLFLVHSESEENPYVSPRPFRVNAGAVHAYVLTPGNKTKYLSELKSGDAVLILNHKGETKTSNVGRIKLERRPMLLIEATYNDQNYSVILQNAETIRLTKKNGAPVSVVSLKKGDKILAYLEKQGRHFGLRIEESITEK
ncbi:MAG: 3-dehydroquinate synthase II [Spirochaetes bacterium]|nr:3-dehydroquinate synthase II [Spirochaetota bacterium]